MNRVKLPKAVCNALDDLITENFTNYQIINLTAKRQWTDAECMCLNSQDVNTIMRALVIGYEVELSAEERMKEFYDYPTYPNNVSTTFDLMRHAIRVTLQIHNIDYDWLGASLYEKQN